MAMVEKTRQEHASWRACPFNQALFFLSMVWIVLGTSCRSTLFSSFTGSSSVHTRFQLSGMSLTSASRNVRLAFLTKGFVVSNV